MYCVGIKEKYEDLSGDSFYYFSFVTSQSDNKWRKFTNQIPMFFDTRYLDIWFDKTADLSVLTINLTFIKLDGESIFVKRVSFSLKFDITFYEMQKVRFFLFVK